MPLPLRAAVLVACAASLSAQASWTRLYPPVAPSLRFQHAMTFEAQLGEVVVFGGMEAGYVYRNDLWGWNGTQWHQITSTGSPPARAGHRIVYDSIRHVLVLFGGWNNNTSTGFTDTWERVGTQWQQRSPVHFPAARTDCGMAFDSNRGRTVVFGGQVYGGSSLLNDTWEWNGTDWQQRTLPTAPAARYGPMLAYDSAHRVCVLFGGGVVVGGSSFSAGDTWTWNGTAWQVQQPPHQPPPSAGVVGTWDAARARLVTGPIPNANFSWEWDGHDWSLVLQAPPSQGPLAYDAGRRLIVLYGNQWQPYANHGDTWTYETANPGQCSTYGAGCPGSVGVPVLANEPDMWPWVGDTFRTRVAPLAAASSLAVFTTGLAASAPLDLTGYGMPGCLGLVTIASVDFAGASAGAASWSVAVPNSPAFQGVHLFQQAFVFEPAANAAGVVASNGIDFEIGVR